MLLDYGQNLNILLSKFIEVETKTKIILRWSFYFIFIFFLIIQFLTLFLRDQL